MADCCGLEPLTEESLVLNLLSRFQRDQIYVINYSNEVDMMDLIIDFWLVIRAMLAMFWCLSILTSPWHSIPVSSYKVTR